MHIDCHEYNNLFVLAVSMRAYSLSHSCARVQFIHKERKINEMADFGETCSGLGANLIDKLCETFCWLRGF